VKKHFLCLFSLISGLLVASVAVAVPPTRVIYQVGAILCPNQTPELLDLYEGRVLRGLMYEETQTFARAVENFRARMTDRADLYQRTAQEFETKKQMIQPGNFPRFDSQDLIIQIPAHCQISTVIQSDLIERLEIDQTIWGQLPESSRSAAVLNWVIAKEVFGLSGRLPPNSIYIRSLNSLFPTSSIRDLHLSALVQMLKSAGLQTIRQQGVLVDLTKPYLIENELFRNATPVVGSSWQFVPPDQFPGRVQMVKLKGDLVRFFPNGAVDSLRFTGKLMVPTVGGEVPIQTPDGFSTGPFEQDISPRIHFFPDRILESGVVLDQVPFQTLQVKVTLGMGRYRDEQMDNSRIYFDEGGILSTLSKVKGAINFQGQWLRLEGTTAVVLWDNGIFHEFTVLDPFYFTVQDKRISWKGYFLFDPDGKMQCGYINETAMLKNPEGRMVRHGRGEQVCFDADGNALGF
jgi:hypothetical protein